jgi:hypothetical protein
VLIGALLVVRTQAGAGALERAVRERSGWIALALGGWSKRGGGA